MAKRVAMISVIVPVYNAEKTLRTCVQSILCQTLSDVEVFLVNDGSTDQSRAICEHLHKEDDRVETINIINSGPAFARNIGIDRASGDYICFVDSDDMLEPDALATLLKYSTSDGIDMSVCDFIKVVGDRRVASGNGRVFRQDTILSKQDTLAYAKMFVDKPYLYTMLMHCWGVLYNASIIREKKVAFDPGLRNLEDVDFNFKYLVHVNKVAYINKALYNYSIQDNKASASMKIGGDMDRFRQYRKAFETVANYAKIETGHGYVSYMIIMLMRTCMQPGVYDFVNEVVNDGYLRGKLRYYHPSSKDSRLIPLLIRLRWVRLLIWVCRYKFERHRRKRKK